MKHTSEKKPTGLVKMRLPLRLEPETLNQVEAEAKERRVSRQQVLEAAIKDRYCVVSQEERDALIARRLNRLDSRQKVIERQLEIIAESQALFMRMWLATSTEVPEGQREAVHGQAQKRYERFLASLSKRVSSGQSIFAELPREVVLREADFQDSDP